MINNLDSVNSLYIHIPFCNSICPYCDFLKIFKNLKLENIFINEILKDLDFLISKNKKLKTIYIGGGTPTCLEIENLKKLLNKINLLKDENCEFSIESTPDSLNKDVLETLFVNNVNRISIGIQTFNKNILKTLNRNNDNIFELIKLVKQYINNINIDFIYGFPNETKEEILHDLNIINKLDVNHVSFYSLTVSENTKYFLDGVEELNDEDSINYYEFIVNNLKNMGFKHYEVSNFAKSGYECKHNLAYWTDNEYIGIGPSASGFVNNIRYTNSNNISKYLKGIREFSSEEITQEINEEYFFITNLRLLKGFNISEFNNKFKIDFLKKYENKINKLKENNLIKIENDHFSCTFDGILLLNRVLFTLVE